MATVLGRETLNNMIPLAVHKIINNIAAAGGKALLVGGAVGDLVMDREPKDYDLEVFGVDGERLVTMLADYKPKTVTAGCGST